MKKLLAIGLFIAAMLGSASAQFTTVTAQVQDASGNLYAGGSYNINLTLPASPSGYVTLGGNNYYPKSVTGVLDSNANLSVTLGDNSQISPAGTKWTFSICSASGVTCFSTPITISGGSQVITAALQAASAPLNLLSAGSFSGNLVPTVDLSFNLGSASKRWLAIYTSTTGPTGGLTLPSGTDTLVARNTTDTLTNKTLTSPTITGGSFSGNQTGMSLTTPAITGPISGSRIPLVLFATSAAGSAIANTTTQTAVYAANTTHIPANTITTIGQILKASGVAKYSTTGTPTLDSRLLLDTSPGGTVIADSTALTTSNNAANLGVGLNVSCVFSAVGAGGSAMCSGTIGLGGINVFQLSPVTLAFDTTVAHDFVFTEQWGTANVSNTVTGQSLVIERPN